MCPPSRCHALAEELGPKAEVQVLQGLAHGPPMQDPAKVHDALLAFLEKQGAQDDDREGGAEGSEESEESDDNEEAGEEKKEN